MGTSRLPRRLHWRVPGTIVGSLLLGALTAICHHCIYDALDGATVSTDSEQRWIIRGGTALAFLFKMFLTIATGASYVQQLWLTISKRPSSIDQVDGMFDVLKDAGGFIDIPLWVSKPTTCAHSHRNLVSREGQLRRLLTECLQAHPDHCNCYTWYSDGSTSGTPERSRSSSTRLGLRKRQVLLHE